MQPTNVVMAAGIALPAVVFFLVVSALSSSDPIGRRGWTLLTAGCGIGLAAGVVAPFVPAPATTAFWMVALTVRQLTFVFGVASILGARRGPRLDHSPLDAGILAVGVTVCAWVFVIVPRHGLHPPPSTLMLVGFTFAALDFVMLWLTARVVTSHGRRSPRMLLLAAGGVPVLVANVLSNSQLGRNGFRDYQPGGWVNLSWQVCGVLIAAAALLPAHVDESTSKPRRAADRISQRRFVILVLVALSTPAVLVFELTFEGDRRTAVPLVGLSVLMCVLVSMLVLRMANLARLEARRADRTKDQSLELQQQKEALLRALDNQRKLQGELAWRAMHDSLTQVGSRTLLMERLTQVLANGSVRSGLLLIDLDGFKEVNDLYGHPDGDRLLIQVSQRLTAIAGNVENVARLGGDEFALVVEGGDPSACRVVAHVVTQSLREPYQLENRSHHLTASAGLVFLDSRTHDAASALRDADLAMYSVKRSGGDEFAEFALSMRDARERHNELAEGVRTAIAENRLRVAYQPIVDMASRRVVAVEALLRWRAASGRSFSPLEFIAVAEDIGLVSDVGAEVLDTAAAAVAQWNEVQSVSISVNVSGRQLMSTTFADAVLQTLDRHAVPAAALVLEITETVLVHASGAAGVRPLRNLTKLRQHGVRIAVDDFGTGYSSLAYLQRLPIDILKLDRMFISALEDTDARHVRYVGAILALGASLGLPVVAEGVESARQWDILSDLGCPLAQGYYFARPCSQERVVDYFAVPQPAAD